MTVTGSPELAAGAIVTVPSASAAGPGAGNVMLCRPRPTAKDRTTRGAAAYRPLPRWSARSTQVPVPTSVTRWRRTVQTSRAALVTVTVMPDVAAGSMRTVRAFIDVSSGRANVIVCGVFAMWKVSAARGAAAYSSSPRWSACTVQVPPATRVTVWPLTLQVRGVALA
ncbi:hypothetical protein OHA72_40680 [Dactylosporangium sp. NBC_01737]|uniref:hypothetical protein n=1 Tax=Dactylosporangium sp. NBC_01737 TaxID=2975959 RepID=UPI002E15FCEB|nr:hypothetical protein OHA72_40680 [Dactylosporangium sp. NBC_01737]